MCQSHQFSSQTMYLTLTRQATTRLVLTQLDHSRPKAGLLCLTPAGKGYRQPSVSDPGPHTHVVNFMRARSMSEELIRCARGRYCKADFVLVDCKQRLTFKNCGHLYNEHFCEQQCPPTLHLTAISRQTNNENDRAYEFWAQRTWLAMTKVAPNRSLRRLKPTANLARHVERAMMPYSARHRHLSR